MFYDPVVIGPAGRPTYNVTIMVNTISTNWKQNGGISFNVYEKHIFCHSLLELGDRYSICCIDIRQAGIDLYWYVSKLCIRADVISITISGNMECYSFLRSFRIY